MLPDWLQILLAFGSPVFAAGGAFAAVRVHLQWLRADVNRAHARLDLHDTRIEAVEATAGV